MSQSTLASQRPRSWKGTSNDLAVIDAEDEVQNVLNVLEDPDCRTILEATGDDARSASELKDRCDIPLSTIYRKLDLLADAGLLEESTRIRRSGKHTSEYERRVEKVEVSIATDGGFELNVTQRPVSNPGRTSPAFGGW